MIFIRLLRLYLRHGFTLRAAVREAWKVSRNA